MVHPLVGTVRVVPDKSITHRGVLLAALAAGTTVLEDPNPGEDCSRTLGAVEALGVAVARERGAWRLTGGLDRLREPDNVLDLGNSGTGMRLLTGLLAGLPFLSILTGDASLRGRPMQRIVEPLRRMGARLESRENFRAPLVVQGGSLRGIRHELSPASAQVKSALLLAGLSLQKGEVRVLESIPSRDHSERMLVQFGARLAREENEWVLCGPSPLGPQSIRIPGDFSAATFLLVAGAITPGSRITVEGVGLNPTRTGALDVLQRMGARLQVELDPIGGAEPVGRITVEAGPLRATVVEGVEIPRLIDEVPILALAAARAEGTTEFRDVGELRVKESDRIRSVCDLLRALGVEVTEEEDRFSVRGPVKFQSARVRARDDHRIAMTALVAAAASEEPVEVDSLEMVATSDPDFLSRLALLRGESA